MLKPVYMAFMGILFSPTSSWAQSDFMDMQFDSKPAQELPSAPEAPAKPVAPPGDPDQTRPPTASPSIVIPSRKPVIVTPADAVTEASTHQGPCPSCSAAEKNMRDLQALINGKIRMGDLTSWKRSRELVQVPTRGQYGNIGPCGSFHYNPDHNKKSGELMDNYANPLTACALMSLLQDWKKRCPDSQQGCRVAWGDISHKTNETFNGHSSHTQGRCIDIRPMRQGNFDNKPLYYQDSDRKLTAEFIQLAKEKGASPILYNDPEAGGKYHSGHANHMHICFKSNKKTKDTCAKFKYDANICGPN